MSWHPDKNWTNEIIEKKQPLEALWKKVHKPTAIKTGMSEALREIDKRLNMKAYDSRDMYNHGAMKLSKDHQEGLIKWSKMLAQSAAAIEKVYNKRKWTPEESKFVVKLMKELNKEAGFFLKRANSITINKGREPDSPKGTKPLPNTPKTATPPGSKPLPRTPGSSTYQRSPN